MFTRTHQFPYSHARLVGSCTYSCQVPSTYIRADTRGHASMREYMYTTTIPRVPSHHSPHLTSPSSATDPSLPFSNTTTPAQAKKFFFREYSNVLMKKEYLQLSPLRPIKGQLMRIHLREDAKPFAIHTPWQNPVAFQGAIQQELQWMVTLV